MFYYEKKKEGYYIWNDKSVGKYGPFLSVYVKNTVFGNDIFSLDLSEFSGYKYALGITGKRIFILGKEGDIKVLNNKSRMI